MAKLLTAEDFASTGGKLLSEEDFGQPKKLLTEDDFAVGAPKKLLSESDLAPETPKPTLATRLGDAVDNSAIMGVPVSALKPVVQAGGKILDAVIDNPLTRGLAGVQQRLLDDPDTAGPAAAVMAPVEILVGADTAVGSTERENRHRAALEGIDYTPQGKVDPLVAEKLMGTLGRIGLSGGAAPVVEAGAKLADISMHEPEEDVLSGTSLGRAAVSGAAVGVPMAAGAAVASKVASSGLGKLGGFLTNAGADLAAGYASGVGSTVGEKLLTEQDIAASDFAPSAIDAAGAFAAGLGGLRASRGAKVPETGDMGPSSASNPEIDTAPIKEGYESGALERPQDPAQVENEARSLALQAKVSGEPQIAKAINDALDGKPTTPEQRQMLRGLGLSPLGLRNISLTKGASDGLQQREVQGETASGPRINRQSQEIAATPEPQAGMGVINLAGDQGAPAAPGRPIGLGIAGATIDPNQPAPYVKNKLPFEVPLNKTRDQLQQRGAGLRDEEGIMPTRVSGINIDKFAPKDEGLQNLTAGMADINADDINAQRGEFTDVLERAAKIDKWKDLKAVENLKTNEVLNDENATSLDNFKRGAVAKFRENPTVENYEVAAKYMKASAGVGSAQGRALGARAQARVAWEREAEPFDVAMVKTHELFSDAGVKDMPKWAVDELANIKDKSNRQQITDALHKIATRSKGIRGQIGNYRFFNMLSSPATQELNIVSNGLKTLVFPVHHAGARGLDAAAPGQRKLATGETRAAVAGAYAGLADAGRRAMHVFKHGYTVDAARSLDPKEMHGELFGGGKNPMNYPSRLLFGVDEFFKGVNEGAALSMLAHRKLYFEGKEKGLKGKELDQYISERVYGVMTGDKKVAEEAKAFAKRAVLQQEPFTNLPEPGKELTKIERVAFEELRSHITPFFRIIANAAKEGMTYTGGGYLAATPLGRGMTREARAEAVSKAMIGTAAVLTLLPYAEAGKITGGVPSDPAEREKFYEQKKEPYSIWLGDTFGWVDYRMLGPLSVPLMGLTSYTDALKTKELDPKSNVALNTATGLLKTIADLPVIAGIGSLSDVLSEPERYGPNFVSNIASQYVPAAAFQRWLNKTGIAGNEVYDAKTVGEKIQAGTVLDGGGLGLSPLAQKRNSFGNPVTRTGKPDPVFAEMERLGIKPMSPPTNVVVQGKSRGLTPEEQREVLAAGQPAYEQIVKLMNSERYKKMSKDRQKLVFDSYMRGEGNSLSGYRSLGLSRIKARGNPPEQAK